MKKLKVLTEISAHGSYVLEFGEFNKVYINFVGLSKNPSVAISSCSIATLTFNSCDYLIDYLSNTKQTDQNNYFIKSVIRKFADHIAFTIISSMRDVESDIKCSIISNKYESLNYKNLVSDLELCINRFIINIREEILRNIYLDRIKMMCTFNDFRSIDKCGSCSIEYFAVPLDGDILTNDPKNMILVKSDRRNLYENIINKTLDMIRNNEIQVYNDNKTNVQLSGQFTESMIPFV